MVFSDLFFLFVFLPAFALCYLLGAVGDRIFRGRRNEEGGRSFVWRNAVLVLFSLIFYAWGEPVYVFLMLACVLLNYLAGLAIARGARNEKRGFGPELSRTGRKAALVAGLVGNLLILGTFKYLSFFAGVLGNIGIYVPDPKLSLPIGISFYTFQSISYLVDVYRGEAPVQRRFGNLLLYISMFPQLIAGPIVRYNTIALEIKNRHATSRDVADGIFRFMIGLGKKVILANQLSEISDAFLTNGLGELTTTGSWVGIVAFTLQIYFDFSGYSDMAIGLGRCLGFHFNENFRHPYCCNSITDFWRRWHISLGSFFRDYVYIPLGGNRRHQAVNILVVWFLTGMWHGASWNFIIWGLYFGMIVMIEKYTVLRIQRFVPSPLLHVYSLALVVIGWGIFYFDDFDRMLQFFGVFFGQSASFHDFVTTSALTDNCWLWVVSLLLVMPVRSGVEGILRGRRNEEGVFGPELSRTGTRCEVLTFAYRLVLSMALLVLSVALLVGATNNAFLYTRF